MTAMTDLCAGAVVYAPDFVCSLCLDAFPRTGVYFHKHPGSRDGLMSWCKACNYEQALISKAKARQP